MKSKINPADRDKGETAVNDGSLSNTLHSKQLPNEVKQNNRGWQNTTQPRTLKAFLSDKLPQKTVSDRLALSIKEKIKAYHK
ncbi:MAG: hypothetical protein IPM47_01085 [Sphingobacteriales bacterium]|nr:MAG: hypothetical protein IPM47_01085 [Sphingobacteriales bacterium]